MKNKILFQEKQEFTQWWLWLLLLGTSIPTFYYTIKANTTRTIIENEYSSPDPGSFTQVLREEYISHDSGTTFLMVLPLVLIILLFLILRLETIIDAKGITIRYFPFLKKYIKWSEVKTTEIVKYGFVGYGIRSSMKHGTVYNVKGSHGLFITLKNGKKRLIGTQKPDEMRKVIAELGNLWV